MAVLGTFGSFTTARLGIYASQASLNVTGNNIANINTVGYTRQRMDLVSLNSTGTAKYASSFMVDVGYGVLCESTSQLRDPYLDIRFRNEQAAVGKTETWLEGLDQLSHILDEVGRGTDDFGVIADQIHEFFDALQGLQQRVGTDEYDDLVRSAGSTLVKLFNSGAKGLETIRANEFKKLQDSMKDVNSILNNIRDLNKQIRTQGIYGDNALELRDARNVELDKLSKYMKINVTYSMEKIDQYTEVEKMTVSLADSGNPPIVLVDGIYGRQFDMPEQSAMPNPAYDPQDPKGPERVDYSDPDYINKYFEPTDDPNKAAKVYSFSEDHLEENRYLFQLTDMVDEKGHYMRDKYGVEIKDEPVDVSDTLLYGSIQSLREILTEEGEFSEDYDVALDPNAKTKRGIPYYQKVMDNWAQTFYEEVNASNQRHPAHVDQTTDTPPNEHKDPAGADGCFLDANGMHVTYKDKDGNTVPVKSTKEVTENGVTTTVPKEISDYTADELKALRDSAQLKEEYSFYDGGVLFSNSGDGNDPTGITAKNISIAYDWDKGAVRVLNTKEANTYDASKGEWSSHTTRQDNILHMINLIGEKRGFVASDTVANVNDGGKAFFNGTFEEMFTGLSGTPATDRNATTKLYSDHSVTSLNLDNSRASVSGVDLNDEATSMMQFEKSYSAACRLLTTLDSMLDKLINGTAI